MKIRAIACIRGGVVPLLFSIIAAIPSLAAPKIGVLLGDSVSPFGRELSRACSDIGTQRRLAIALKTPPSAENVAQMQRLLAGWENDADIKALIVACGLGASELSKSLQPFVARGVPVVALLGHLSPGVAKATVLVDENAVIAAAVAECVRLAGPTAEVAMLRSNLREGQMNDRERLVIRGLHERYPDLPIHADVFMNADGSTPAAQAKLLLEKYPKITLVYSPYTTATMAMIAAIHDTGRTGHIAHVGIGAGVPPECADALEHGELTALVAMAPHDVADKAMTAAADLLAGRPVPEVVYSSVQVATKSGVHAVDAATPKG